MEVARYHNERIVWAHGDVQSRIDVRVQAVLQEVSENDIEQLDDDDRNCAVCYSRLENDGPHAGNAPRRLPCGHILCVDCANAWLGKTPGTCPTCRADFNLALGHATDFIEVLNPVTAAVGHDLARPPTPWWMAIFRPT